jgi:hypothetical protein
MVDGSGERERGMVDRSWLMVEDRRQKAEGRRQKAEDSHMGVGWTGFENLGADVPLTPPSHGVLFTDRLDDR